MSSSDFRRAGVALLMLLLAGCGWEPLYGDSGVTGEGATAELAAVKVAAIRNRAGQELYNYLLDRINPLGRPADPKYLLVIRLTEGGEGIAISRDSTASRVNLTVTASYSLQTVNPAKEVFRAYSRSTTSYNVLRELFATQISAADARRRALRDLSDDIANRIAVYLSGQEEQQEDAAQQAAEAP